MLLLMPMVMDHISIYSVLDTDAGHGVLISSYSDPKNQGILLCPFYLLKMQVLREVMWLLVEEQGIPKQLFYLNKESPLHPFCMPLTLGKGKLQILFLPVQFSGKHYLSVSLFIVKWGLVIYSLGCPDPRWFHSWQSSCLRLCIGRIRACNTTPIQPSGSKPFCYFLNFFTYF